MSIVIPEHKQIDAICEGLGSVYKLLQDYGANIHHINCWRYITVSREQLRDHLKSQPELANLFINAITGTVHHEFPVLEKIGDKYTVYTTIHGLVLRQRFYDDLYEALADYLMFNIPNNA
jgi:hypothetical protein